MKDADVAIAIFLVEFGNVRYSTSRQYALTSSHVTRMLFQLMDCLQDGGCMFWGFELLTVMALKGQSGKGHEGKSISATPIRVLWPFQLL